jgi:hypothetical protein
METALILLVAATFLGMGVVALARPAFVLGLFGTRGLTRDGENEVRAVYGGFGVAVAVVLAAAIVTPAIRDGVLVAIAVSLAGMAAGRLVSSLIDGLPGPFPRLVFLGEAALCAALLAAR